MSCYTLYAKICDQVKYTFTQMSESISTSLMNIFLNASCASLSIFAVRCGAITCKASVCCDVAHSVFTVTPMNVRGMTCSVVYGDADGNIYYVTEGKFKVTPSGVFLITP